MVTRLPLLLRTLSYFRRDRALILWLLAAIGGSTLLGLMQVWPLALLVDSVLHPGQSTPVTTLPGFATTPAVQIALLALYALLLRVGQETLSTARGMLAMRINHSGMLRVRCDLFRKLQSLNVLYHRSKPQADSIYRLSTDAGSCQALLNVFLDLLVAAITLVVMVAVMSSRSLWLTGISMSVVPLIVLTNIGFTKVLQLQTLMAKETDSQFLIQVQRAVSTFPLIAAFGRESLELNGFQTSAQTNLKAWYRLHWQFSLYRLCIGLIFGLGGALIFGLGGWQVYQDQFVAHRPGGMTSGDLVMFITYLSMFYDPLCKLTGAGASLQDALASAQRVFEILDRDPVIVDAPNAIDLPRQPRQVALRDVSFSYPGGSPVLNDINVAIEPGQFVAFVGPSGAGKSTLLNLFPRFLDPNSGALELDGIDIRGVKLGDLRKHVALVLQDGIILPTTIRENIAYGRTKATDEQIRQAAIDAGLGAFLDSLPNGLDTPIVEGGQNLSGGQRQRIAIARALLTEAPILVLDEPTSALDATHERLVTETLLSLRGQRTIIVVSHRLSTIAEADRIFVMRDGEIVEAGTHADLLAAEGDYFGMLQQQSIPARAALSLAA